MIVKGVNKGGGIMKYNKGWGIMKYIKMTLQNKNGLI